MFWRTPNDWLFRYAVDAEGRLILGEWEGDTTPYVIRLEIENGNIFTNERSYEEVPELNTWGNSPKTAAFGGNNETTIDYDGQHYVIAPDGSTITPELSNYQP